VDQRFADYEAEIRFLRNNLAEAEKSLREVRKSLREAKEAADDSNHALDAAQDAIADRDYEIEVKKNVIAELERDVKHCQRHHPPPTPPSKWRGSDGAVSRFNVDANRSPKSPDSKNSATALSPSLIGRSFAASPKSISEGSSTASAPKTPRSTFSGAPSPSTGGSPFPQSHQRLYGAKSSTYTPLPAEALATALSSAAGPSKSLGRDGDGQSPDIPHVRKNSLEQLLEATNKSSTTSATQKQHHRSRRAMPPSASTPNLRDAQNTLPWNDAPALPPRLPMMSGGLGIIEGPTNETQEQKFRKMRGALGDIFRRKDQGPAIVDDMVRHKDQGSTMNDIAHALDYCGI
jgi:hypothetical protein